MPKQIPNHIENELNDDIAVESFETFEEILKRYDDENDTDYLELLNKCRNTVIIQKYKEMHFNDDWNNGDE